MTTTIRDELAAALKQLLKNRSVNTLEEAAREYPHGKADVAQELTVFNAARAALARHNAAKEAEPDAREFRVVRHPVSYEHISACGTVRKLDGEFWRYECTDVDCNGEFDRLHRARAPGEKP